MHAIVHHVRVHHRPFNDLMAFDIAELTGADLDTVFAVIDRIRNEAAADLEHAGNDISAWFGINDLP